MVAFLEQFANFVTVFLGIFIEAVPFLLLGTLASGMVEVFVGKDDLACLMPRNPIAATALGGLMGFAFPVCECGVVPLTRRLFKKGMPISAGIAFLLAAPILNPIVLASTYAAYGWGTVLVGRYILAAIVALGVGLLFALNRRPYTLLGPQSTPLITGGSHSLAVRLRWALRIAGDEFFEMGGYLVVGSLLAAALQTLVPQSTLLTVGSGPIASVIAMEALAFVLSVGSTVDTFLSLTFVNTFTTGSTLAFLVFGPMVDIKSMLMFLGVFRRKAVAYLVALPLLMITLLTLCVNLNPNF